MAKEPITTRLDTDTKQEVEDYATERGIGQTEAARRLIRAGLDEDTGPDPGPLARLGGRGMAAAGAALLVVGALLIAGAATAAAAGTATVAIATGAAGLVALVAATVVVTVAAVAQLAALSTARPTATNTEAEA